MTAYDNSFEHLTGNVLIDVTITKYWDNTR